MKLIKLLKEIKISPSVPKFMELNDEGGWNYEKFWVNVLQYLQKHNINSFEELCKNCIQWKFNDLKKHRLNIDDFNKEYFKYLQIKIKNMK